MDIEIIRNIAPETNSKLPFFAKQNYLESVSAYYGWFVNKDFILPFVEHKKYIFRYLTLTNQTVYLNNNNSNQNETAFLNAVVVLAKKKGFDFITQPPTTVLFNSVPDNSEFAAFGSYIIELSEAIDTLFKNMDGKHRNVIRKAERDGIIVEKGEHLKDICYGIINETLKRQNLFFFSKSNYEKFLKQNPDVVFFAARKGNDYQGAAIIPFDENCAYYLYGGSALEHHLGAMNLLHWDVIQYFKKKGCKEYNLVGARINPRPGTKLYNIQQFKRRFGAELRSGYLWKIKLNIIKTLLFNKIVYLKTLKKQKDIIDYEKQK